MSRAWLALLVCLALQACAANEADERAKPEAAALSYDARGWLMLIAHAHAQADEALSSGRADQAHGALQAALQRAVPPEVSAEHVRWLHQDLWYRLSAVDLEREPARALIEAERGLALGQSDDMFSSNLLAARGHALRALGRDTEAASSYHAAIKIDERLLDAALGGGGGGP